LSLSTNLFISSEANESTSQVDNKVESQSSSKEIFFCVGLTKELRWFNNMRFLLAATSISTVLSSDTDNKTNPELPLSVKWTERCERAFVSSYFVLGFYCWADASQPFFCWCVDVGYGKIVVCDANMQNGWDAKVQYNLFTFLFRFSSISLSTYLFTFLLSTWWQALFCGLNSKGYYASEVKMLIFPLQINWLVVGGKCQSGSQR